MGQEYTIKEEAKEKHFIKHFINCTQWSQEVNKDQDSETAIGFGKKEVSGYCDHWNRKDAWGNVQSVSHVWLLATSWVAACQASLSFTIFQSLLKLMSTELMMLSNHFILLCPVLLLPSTFTSIGVFRMSWLLASGGQSIGVSASASVLPMNIQDWLISFRMDWLDLLAVQGTFKSLLQYHSSKASIIHHAAFLIVQLSHPYMTTGKTITLTRWTIVSEVMSLLFNILSRLVIAFLSRSKCLLRSWHPVPSLHGKQMGKQWKQWQTLFWGTPKSLQMVITAMKLKDAYSLEENLWPT